MKSPTTTIVGHGRSATRVRIIMTLKELKTLGVGDIVDVQWTSNSPIERGTVVEVKKYADTIYTVQVKTEFSLGEYRPPQVKLVSKAGNTELQELVEEFIKEAIVLLGIG